MFNILRTHIANHAAVMATRRLVRVSRKGACRLHPIAHQMPPIRSSVGRFVQDPLGFFMRTRWE